MANHYAENPEELEELELKINLPSANTAGHTPDATQPFPDADAFIQPVATMQPLSPPSHLTNDTPGFITPQLDAITPQGQASAWHPTQDNNNTSAVPSCPAFPPSPTGIDMTFTPGVPPTYSGVDFLTHLGFPTSTQSYDDVSSSMPVATAVPAISTSSASSESADLKLPFTPTSCEPASLYDPTPGPSWSSTSSEATGTFVSHVPATDSWSPTLSLAPFDLFAHGEASDFDAWCQSYPLS